MLHLRKLSNWSLEIQWVAYSCLRHPRSSSNSATWKRTSHSITEKMLLYSLNHFTSMTDVKLYLRCLSDCLYGYHKMHLFLVVYVKGTIWKWIKNILGYILAFRLFPGNSRKCGNFDLQENRIFFSKLLIEGPFLEKLKHFLWPNLTLAWRGHISACSELYPVFIASIFRSQ